MINNVVLIGRIVRDVEMNLSHGGTEVVRFTLAVNRSRKNANGEYDADFINCVAFGQSARFMSQYIRKGYQVAVTGRIQTGSYENQQGQKVYTTDVIIENVNNLEQKPKQEQGNYPEPTTFQPQPPVTQGFSTHPQTNNANVGKIDESDLPF